MPLKYHLNTNLYGYDHNIIIKYNILIKTTVQKFVSVQFFMFLKVLYAHQGIGTLQGTRYQGIVFT